MLTGFIRAIILYLLIIAGIRLMGKRQVGELEPSELVLSLIIADLAAVPMQDFGIPLLAGIIPILTLLALTMTLAKPMEAYQLGEAYARSLGVNVRRFRLELILLSSLLSACVTAFAGPISFVGIAVPHLVKSLLKTAKPLVVLPACALGGAGFCMLCDLLARTLFAPTELNISSVTAVFGAPVVIGLMVSRQSRRSRGGMAG